MIAELTKRFVAILSDEERLIVAEENLQLAKATAEEVQKRVKATIAPEPDLGRALAAVDVAHLQLSSLRQQYAVHKMALANMWGSLEADFDSLSGSLYAFGEERPFDDLFQQLEQNPRSTLYTAENRLKEAELRMAKVRQKSDLTWSVGVKRDEVSDDSALVIGFSLPLMSEQRANGAITSALAARDEVRLRQQGHRLRLYTQLYEAYTSRQQAIKSSQTLAQKIIPNLTKSLQQTKYAYQRGLYSYLDFLTARQELLAAKQDRIDAAEAALLYTAEIEQLTAQPLFMMVEGN
ncbi:hypothetical protein LCGC14_1476090 [marine sediment metagenome]|uniref:Outer membrane efflux protein n=2 Tax=root TaxID=1 RepID=A0A0F9JWW6_9ZZZZ